MPPRPPTTSLPDGGASVELALSGYLDRSDPVLVRSLQVAAGEVWASVSWSGSVPLRLALACGGAREARRSSAGAYLSVAAAAGACVLTVEEVHLSGAPIGYDAVLSYRRPAPPAP